MYAIVISKEGIEPHNINAAPETETFDIGSRIVDCRRAGVNVARGSSDKAGALYVEEGVPEEQWRPLLAEWSRANDGLGSSFLSDTD
ncbi:hypothetical protein [Lysobacter sp. Root559]|uniref:hypothetical protein n=1 Tax=Lysobacter sp. Root559 TaxID=1736559 RepID=UPI000A90CCE8|nr:hypothetical protein [Lysobacter sp. Root559]